MKNQVINNEPWQNVKVHRCVNKQIYKKTLKWVMSVLGDRYICDIDYSMDKEWQTGNKMYWSRYRIW